MVSMKNGAERNNYTALCPSCERFIGPADTCPYCGSESAKSPILRKLRYTSLITAFSGLLLLYLISIHKTIPAIKISSIKPTMNFARVHISGRVEYDAKIYKKNNRVNYMSFLVNDGTDRILVSVYKNAAEKLVNINLIPEQNMQIGITGTLKIRPEGRTRLILQSEKELTTDLSRRRPAKADKH
jgi:hypothetical protein